MKRLLTVFLAAVLLSGMLMVGKSHAFLTNWTFDPAGGNPVLINEFLDIVGPNYVTTNLEAGASLGTPYTFDNFGFFTSPTHDGGATYPWALSPQITGIYQASGQAVLGGELIFTSGNLQIFSDLVTNFATSTPNPEYYGANGGVKIAEFDLIFGEGMVGETALPNGVISLQFQSTYLAPNVWFTNSTDLADLPYGFTFGYSTTNASLIEEPSIILQQEMYNYISSLGFNLPNPLLSQTPFAFYLSSNGQFRVNVVPEPSTILLLGAGLLGLGIYGRRKITKK